MIIWRKLRVKWGLYGMEVEDKKELLIQKISKELTLSKKQIQSVIQLYEEGHIVPFIARYRKEMTGALDEVQIKGILDNWTYLQNLEQRKEDVVRLIAEQGKLTDELEEAIMKADKLQTVEDLYRPYKQKRRTRATMAKEKGLEPLANWILQFPVQGTVEEEAAKYVNEEKGVSTIEEAIKGAQD